MDWMKVFDESPSMYTTFKISADYEKIYLPEGLQVYLVEHPKHVPDALERLRASMQDRVIAIDLEWRPEVVAGRFSPVALMQLSSSTVCVLIRVSSMSFVLPPAVKAFLEDPSLVLLGFGWDSSDENKMKQTFSMGKAQFRRFVDLQHVGAALGYQSLGLAKMTKMVLGHVLPKVKAISRSNWAARKLTMHQIKYAALDVFATGQVYRGLRLWHSSPSPCSSCLQPMGAPSPLTNFTCHSCGTDYHLFNYYQQHCINKGHAMRFMPCVSCGRVYELPEPVHVEGAGTGVFLDVPGGEEAGEAERLASPATSSS